MDWKEYSNQQNGETSQPPVISGQNPGTTGNGYVPQQPPYYPQTGNNGSAAPPYPASYPTPPYAANDPRRQTTVLYYPDPNGSPTQTAAPPPAYGAPYGQGGYGQGIPPAGGYVVGGTGYAAPPPGIPVYGQPPVYGIPQPAYVPPVADTTHPLYVTASRRVTFEQYKRLNKRSGQLLAVILVLIVTLIWGGITIFLAYPYETSGFILTIALTAISQVVGIILAARLVMRRNRAIQETYACAQASGTGEGILELYSDRVQAVSMRGSSVVYLHTAVLWEMADMLALVGPGATIVWRAEDLTPEAGRTIYHLLIQRMAPGNRRIREPFIPRAPFPLPLPAIHNDDEVRAVVRTRQMPESIGRGVGIGMGRILPMLTPFLTILGTYLAAYYALTTSFTVDILLFELICWGSGVALSAVILALVALARRNKQPVGAQEVAYAFTRDGMARRQAGGTVFVPYAFIKKQLRGDGVELKTPYGSGFIRWSDAPDPTALRAALELGGQTGANHS